MTIRVNRAERGKWVSVKDVLPEPCISVFVTNGHHVWVEWQRYPVPVESWESERRDITHWMSIEYPEPPKQ